MTKLIPVRNPRTGQDDFSFEAVCDGELKRRCQSLRAKQSMWAGLSLDQRLGALNQLAESISRNPDALLDALMTDTGRLAISQIEVGALGNMIARIEPYARQYEMEEERQSRVVPAIRYRTTLSPYPLVGVISPWNFPLSLSLIDAIPALIAGCAVMIKPSEITPRFAEPLLEMIQGVPLLCEVMDIALGDGATGASLVGEVDAICFTGSVATGRKVAVSAATHFIPAFLELGGKDAAIVLADADIERAANAIARGGMLNSGQACWSTERVYVDEKIFEPFVQALTEKVAALTLNVDRPGDGQIGPLIMKEQAQVIDRHLRDAQSRGALLRCGGEIEDHGGLWCQPTVVTQVPQDSVLMQEETFGPVLPVVPFESEDQAVDLANDTVYGLSGAVFGSDLARAEAVARQINAGGMSVNDCGLAGFSQEAEKDAFANSGMGGSRMGPAGYTRFFRRRAVMTNTGDALPF